MEEAGLRETKLLPGNNIFPKNVPFTYESVQLGGRTSPNIIAFNETFISFVAPAGYFQIPPPPFSLLLSHPLSPPIERKNQTKHF